jgi:hypothetical protein
MAYILFQQGLVHSSSAAYYICFIVLFQRGLVHSSSAAYFICFIVLFQRGLVHSSSAAYFIEPVLGQTDVSSGHPHIVYKSSSLPLKFLNTRDHSAQVLYFGEDFISLFNLCLIHFVYLIGK